MRKKPHGMTKEETVWRPLGGAYLRLDQALNLMHRPDARMANMHTPSGLQWFILPGGGRVRPADAAKIIARPDIRGQGDCLFPGLSQTWRMVR
jgi:hypothetical protein